MCVTITKAWGQGQVDKIMAKRSFLVDISHKTYCRRARCSVCTIYAMKKNVDCLILEPRLGGGRCERRCNCAYSIMNVTTQSHQLGAIHALSPTNLIGH